MFLPPLENIGLTCSEWRLLQVPIKFSKWPLIKWIFSMQIILNQHISAHSAHVSSIASYRPGSAVKVLHLI
uniref:Uncharacterized protein n=1 Tax=Arundo donax TaxID=35708 RepID=A0A0A9HQC0_ARUDO